MRVTKKFVHEILLTSNDTAIIFRDESRRRQQQRQQKQRKTGSGSFGATSIAQFPILYTEIFVKIVGASVIDQRFFTNLEHLTTPYLNAKRQFFNRGPWSWKVLESNSTIYPHSFLDLARGSFS